MFTVEKHKRINQIISYFHFSGVWQNGDGRVYQAIGSKLFYLIGAWMLIVSMANEAILCKDWSEKTFLASIGMTGIVHSVRIIYALWKKDEILEFIDYMNAHSVPDRDKYEDIRNQLKYFADFVFAYVLMIIIGFACAVIMTLPLFWSHKRLVISGMWFPFDWKTNYIGYWAASGCTYMFCIVIFVSVLFSIIVWYVMLSCSIQYDILGHQFKNLGKIREREIIGKTFKMSEADRQNRFLEEFLELFKNYQELRMKIDQFKSFFSPLFFIQITTSGIDICCIIYALVFTYDQNQIVDSTMNMVGIMYCIFDIFMVMYFGNEIKMSSDGLSYSLFQSNWMDQTEQCKVYIKIFTEILKQPQELVIGKLYPLNLNTFTSVMNIAYRSFHILKNLK